MAKHFLTLIEYGTVELHPLIVKNNWFLSSKEVAIALNVPLSKIIESLENLAEDKHYSYQTIDYAKDKRSSSILFFSKSGMVRLAYSLKSDDALKFLEFIEDINLEEINETNNARHDFYNEIEDVLKERLALIKKNPETSLEEINKFILTLDNLVQKQETPIENKRQDQPNINDILKTVVGLAQSYATKPKKI